MKVMFASGDVGGARALLPVIELCEKSSLPFVMFENGHIISEAPERWETASLSNELDRAAAEILFKRNKIGVLVFASSVKDAIPLTLARWARELNIPVIHVLDNWTGYRTRMEKDGLPTFIPDIYTVIDDLAREESIKEGIDASVLKITGQPALASLSREYRPQGGIDIQTERKRLGFDPEKPMIVFVSEPVENDQGASPSSPEFRGYTEKIVLRLFCEALQPHADEIEIGILPHPREDVDRSLKHWNECCGSLKGSLLRLGNGRESLFLADAVAGMASILLYEAWLLGKPVISLQPGLRQKQLRMLQKRNGVVFIDSYEEVTASVTSWVTAIQTGNWTALRPEAQLHEKAPENIFRLAEKFLNQMSFQKVISS